MEDLQIHHVLCSKAELATLKAARVVSQTEDESALITKTDAGNTDLLYLQHFLYNHVLSFTERLVSYFKTLEDPPITNGQNPGSARSTPPEGGSCDEAAAAAAAALNQQHHLEVEHDCFGKARGRLFPSKYSSPSAKCIKCAECGKN